MRVLVYKTSHLIHKHPEILDVVLQEDNLSILFKITENYKLYFY